MRKVNKFNICRLKGLRKPITIFVILSLMLAIAGFIFIRYTWLSSVDLVSKNALKITQASEAGFSESQIMKLSISNEDIRNPDYKEIKNGLMEVRRMYSNVRFVYIYTQRAGKIYFVADSEPESSKDYSPPGQQYTEAKYEDKIPFTDRKPIIEKPNIDRWGRWVSVLAPMEDYKTGEVIAVFGMDYPADNWEKEPLIKTIQAGIMVLSVYLLFFAFFLILYKNCKMKKSQIIIRESEKRLLNAQLLAHVGSWEFKLGEKTIWASEEALNIYGLETNSHYIPNDIIQKQALPEYREALDQAYKNLVTKDEKYDIEYKVENVKTGEEHYVHSIAELLVDENGKPYKIAGTLQDITERKKREEEIFYLSYYDQLTGLYNRRFYEEELKRLDVKRNLPITIAIGDVNGLKLINDTFGHTVGDELLRKTAEILKSGCRADDIIARLGGDEFVILLPKTDSSKAKQLINRLKDMSVSEKVESIDIFISFGYETKNSEGEKIQEIFKKAEDFMYKKKLIGSQSMRSKTIDAIITTLNEKNKREEQHSNRVSLLCKRMGEALGLPKEKIEKLKTVGLLHDIGKIAIDENILNKPSKLSEDEWKEIKRHPEIGYRILNTVNEMSDLANYVLYHHERWDGKGYPKGLKGEEIPFTSRIITIADAYDAMASERSYRSALPEKDIIEELYRNAGIQFDPELVRIFIDKILEA